MARGIPKEEVTKQRIEDQLQIVMEMMGMPQFAEEAAAHLRVMAQQAKEEGNMELAQLAEDSYQTACAMLNIVAQPIEEEEDTGEPVGESIVQLQRDFEANEKSLSGVIVQYLDPHYAKEAVDKMREILMVDGNIFKHHGLYDQYKDRLNTAVANYRAYNATFEAEQGQSVLGPSTSGGAEAPSEGFDIDKFGNTFDNEEGMIYSMINNGVEIESVEQLLTNMRNEFQDNRQALADEDLLEDYQERIDQLVARVRNYKIQQRGTGPSTTTTSTTTTSTSTDPYTGDDRIEVTNLNDFDDAFSGYETILESFIESGQGKTDVKNSYAELADLVKANYDMLKDRKVYDQYQSRLNKCLKKVTDYVGDGPPKPPPRRPGGASTGTPGPILGSAAQRVAEIDKIILGLKDMMNRNADINAVVNRFQYLQSQIQINQEAIFNENRFDLIDELDSLRTMVNSYGQAQPEPVPTAPEPESGAEVADGRSDSGGQTDSKRRRKRGWKQRIPWKQFRRHERQSMHRRHWVQTPKPRPAISYLAHFDTEALAYHRYMMWVMKRAKTLSRREERKKMKKMTPEEKQKLKEEKKKKKILFVPSLKEWFKRTCEPWKMIPEDPNCPCFRTVISTIDKLGLYQQQRPEWVQQVKDIHANMNGMRQVYIAKLVKLAHRLAFEAVCIRLRPMQHRRFNTLVDPPVTRSRRLWVARQLVLDFNQLYCHIRDWMNFRTLGHAVASIQRPPPPPRPQEPPKPSRRPRHLRRPTWPPTRPLRHAWPSTRPK